MPVGRPWVTRRENAPQNIDYSAMWLSSRCPEIHAVKVMFLYLFFGANLEDQTASVFIETTQKNPEEHQKNTRRETAAMSVTAVIQTETTSDFI